MNLYLCTYVYKYAHIYMYVYTCTCYIKPVRVKWVSLVGDKGLLGGRSLVFRDIESREDVTLRYITANQQPSGKRKGNAKRQVKRLQTNKATLGCNVPRECV